MANVEVTVTVEVWAELHELNDAQRTQAYKVWADGRANDDYLLVHETQEWVDSLKALASALGATVRYCIDPFGYSYARFIGRHGDDVVNGDETMSVARRIAWLENNLYAPLRKPWRAARHRYCDSWQYPPGIVPDCPLTGVCFDEDLLREIDARVMAGDTITDALESLGAYISTALWDQYAYLTSEESLLDHEGEVRFRIDHDGNVTAFNY